MHFIYVRSVSRTLSFSFYSIIILSIISYIFCDTYRQTKNGAIGCWMQCIPCKYYPKMLRRIVCAVYFVILLVLSWQKKKIKKNKNKTRHRIKEDCLSGDFVLFYCDFYCCCCWCLWFRGHDNIQYSVCPQLRMLNIVDIYVLSNDGTVNVYCCVFTGIGQCTLNQSHCYIETHIYLIRIGFNADGHDEDYINVSELNHKILCVGRFICCYCSCVRSQT